MPYRTQVRRRVLTLAFLLAVVTYLDRICIAVAAPFIMDELHLSVLQMSVVFSAFTLAYSLFEIPSGWLGDMRGPRRVLTRIVLWWSAFTALTGAARGFVSLVSIRFLFGAGEAGAAPNSVRALAAWFPRAERGRATGVLALGSRVGGMLSAPVALLLVRQWGWRVSFVIFAAFGVVWAAAWAAWFRDRPGDHPAVNAEERAWIEQDHAGGEAFARPTPWCALVSSRSLYAICAMYFAFGYGLYFYFTWLPTFLIRVLGFSLFTSGVFAALPFVLAGIADVAGGWLTDWLSRTRGLRVGRCSLGCAAFLSCAACIVASTIVAAPTARATLLALALASADLALGACWAVPVDIAPDHAGVVTAFMNTFGNLGGLVGPMIIGVAVDRWQTWTFPFYVTAAVYAGGGLAWLAIDPTRAIHPNRDESDRQNQVNLRSARDADHEVA